MKPLKEFRNNTPIERFQEWYRTEGHWFYESKEEAHKTWIERGIEGLPDPDFMDLQP
jgi:hypothetical protein